MSWVKIDSTTLESAAASVTFSSGLSGYKFFRLTAYFAKDGTVGEVRIRFNGDTGTNYAAQRVYAQSTSVSGQRVTGQTSLDLSMNIGANNVASASILVAKPAASLKAQVTWQHGVAVSPSLGLLGGEWNNTSELIDEITLLSSSANFAAGTSILLEGLAF